MNRAEILEKLAEDIQDNLSLAVDPILEEHTLIGDLGLDSLQMVELLMSVEEIFGFEIDDEPYYDPELVHLLRAWKTVGNVVDTVERFFAGA